MANLQMRKVKLSGISKFRIKFVSTEIKEMVARCGIGFDALVLTGDYVLSTFMSSSKGAWLFFAPEMLTASFQVRSR